MDEEQFGPVLPVITYKDVDDAVDRANATNYGLGGSVWTNDLERGNGAAGSGPFRHHALLMDRDNGDVSLITSLSFIWILLN